MTTFLIQGAIMNDGTALVLLNIFLNGLMHDRSETLMGAPNIAVYFVKVFIISPLLGIAFGVISKKNTSAAQS